MPTTHVPSGGKHVRRDPRTGREVWQMTSGPHSSFLPYMYRRAFSHDEQQLIFVSDRGGSEQLYLMDIASAEAVPLTPPEQTLVAPLTATLDAAGQVAYFLTPEAVCAVDIGTGAARTVLDYRHLTRGETAFGFTLNPDWPELLLTYKRPNGPYAFALADTEMLTHHEAHVFPAEVERINHPLFVPGQRHALSYVRYPDRQNEADLPSHARARAWKLELGGQDAPLLIAPPGYRATHEYWAPDGSRLYYHQKRAKTWFPTSINSVAPDGSDARSYYVSATIRLGHSSVNCEQTKLVSDSQTPGENELLLIDVLTGEAEVLCWPNASGRPHPNHVHPAFSPSGQLVRFTSDVSGYAQVYLVPLQNAE